MPMTIKPPERPNGFTPYTKSQVPISIITGTRIKKLDFNISKGAQ